MEFLQYFIDHRGEVLEQTGEHLYLTFISLLLAISLALPLGILLSRHQKFAHPVIGLVNVIQTIPSLALLGFMIPILGIGAVPAIVALFLYALLPIVRNTFTGITEVDQNLVEAARGMGMTSQQSLLKVELPLALPTIFAGIRTATVINIGVATLTALIGAGGLGEFIFRGIALNNMYMILSGAIPAALLAVGFDNGLGIIEKYGLKINFKALIFSTLAVFVVLYLFRISSTDKNLMKAGFPNGFIYRDDGYEGLKEVYNLEFDVIEMQPGLMYDAIKNENVDVVAGFSTDGRIEAFDLVVLEDDKKYFPPYHAAPLVRTETLKNFPEIKVALDKLSGKISEEKMAELNLQADSNINPKNVAEVFLTSIGISTDRYTVNEVADIVIGSKEFTESFILAEMFKLVIENTTSLTVDLKLAFGGTKLVFDALRFGNVDIYAEYTGTALLVLLPEEDRDINIVYEKDVVYRYVKDKFISRYQLTWLSPLGFNNTHAMVVRKSFAEKNRLKSISDLSAFLKETK
jgi:osmoprotectant transport system substrate-binding protein/osmoprotectant transport system permease protein